MLELAAGDARLTLQPDLGGGIAGLWVGDEPVLRPWSGKTEDGPFALASNILVPFSNRIDGGFTFSGVHHAMVPNLDGEPYAIHGDGFQRAWQVTSSDAQSAELHLPDGAFGPFGYEAWQTFALSETSLVCTLRMTNLADMALPYGGGFHPWFPRTPATKLHFNAHDHWPEGEGSLPATDKPQAPPDDFDFAKMRALPGRWINCAFGAWDGKARIEQAEGAMSVSLSSKTLDHTIIYSPEPDCGFFCFEPVSHPVNAHNLEGLPGLTVLEPGQSLSFDMTLDWESS